MALDIFAEFATDEGLEKEGVWKDIGEGSRLLIARAQNKNFNKMVAKMYEENKRILDVKGESADQKSEDIMTEVLAKTILLGWENVEFKGKKLEYNLANAKMLLALKDFRKLVSALSEDQAAYRVQVTEEVQKN